MPFLLSELIGEGPAITVNGINADSRAIRPGDAFFALPGTKAHGNAFIGAAVGSGAAAVVTDTPVAAQVAVVAVDDVRATYARAAAAVFAPQPEITVAVTGTNGKTSVTSFTRQIWDACGYRAAGLGTLGVETADGLEPGSLTTPDSLTLHKSLARLRRDGIDHVAMEASSHGLDQRRLDGLRFRAVAFTNLTRDHLDYHADLDSYRDAKLRLFRELLAEDGTAVVNIDDPAAESFAFAALDRGAKLLTVGSGGSWFEMSDVRNDGFGQRVTGKLAGDPVNFHLPLTGRFQASNAVVALGLAMATGADKARAIAALERLKGAKGRLELIAAREDSAVFVDYAHTPDALKNALESLRPYARGKLTVVFGCGGDRDKGKRPLMGAIARELADRVIVTDDNPRTEDAATIRSEILVAVPQAEEIGDRRAAIASAVSRMGNDGVVLVAGKGHEDYQIIGTTKHHFSDHEAIAGALQELA